MEAMTPLNVNKSILTHLFSDRVSRVYRIGLLTSGLLLGATSLSAHAGSLISSNHYLDYQLPENVQQACGERDNCPDIEIKYLESNHEWINEAVNARINSLVVNSEPTESATVKTTSTPQDIKAALDDFATSQIQDLPNDVSWGYEWMVRPEYLGHVNDFELFDINSYVFTGGAHGMPYSEYLMFDLGSKKQIKLADMLLASQKPRFEALAYEAYQTWVKTVADDVSSYEKSWPFTLSDDVILTDKGINIRYQPYVIGPYAYGMPTLSIPYSKLDTVIKPHFLRK
ncbi:DUF3298 domain-containing protein [Psychrobacter sp. SWN149]|nr:DUF3298 domain-containing protein [Psychrobacter sp. SWN149]